MKVFKWLLISFLIIYISSSVIRGVINNLRILNGYNHVLAELDREEVKNRELKKKLFQTQQNKHVELLARQKLGLVKKGEIVYKIVYSEK